MLKKIILNLGVEVGYLLARLIGKIPDSLMIKTLRLVKFITDKIYDEDFKIYANDILSNIYVNDVLEVYELGPPYTTMIKRMFSEAREKELKDLIRGMIEFD